jgi:hypothetical protein
MNNPSKTVLLSASVVIIAAQAMAVAAKESPAPLDVPEVGDIAHVGGLDAFSKLDVRNAVGKAVPEIAASFRRDGVTILERYHVAQSDFVHDGGIGNPSPGVNETACHSACHQDSGGYC